MKEKPALSETAEKVTNVEYKVHKKSTIKIRRFFVIETQHKG